MNKFLNRNIKPSPSKKVERQPERKRENYQILNQFSACWASLEEARNKLRRSVMYAYEDQWGDFVLDPETEQMIREADLIKKQGKVPLKNNMISPIIKNIDGQFRSNTTQTICSVRDQSEAKIGEMMSIALEYVHDINESIEIDSDSLRLLLCGGLAAQRIQYGYNAAKRENDVWIYPVNPCRLFFNTNIEDPRGWDLNCIGEVFDMTIDKVISLFAKSTADKKLIEDIYGSKEYSQMYANYDGLQGRQNIDITFFSPSRPDLCRVILGWTLERREAYFCNDLLKGTYFYIGLDEKKSVDLENKRRIAEGLQNGMAEDDILLIEYEYKNEEYWYYRYMTPYGDILKEGKSPYWHEQHNYVFLAYPMVMGKVFNFVEDFIDQQKSINRTTTLIDFIRSASSKGVLIVDETAFESMSREELVDQYVRYNGVIFAKLKQGQNVQGVIQQLNGNAAVQGDYELLNLQLKLINDISGVSSAMQGKPATSGTAASLYAQQVQNSSLNLKGLFDTFRTFRQRRDYKVMQTIQQYYTSARHIDLSGRDYSEESKFYNPEKVQNAQIDLKITDGSNTPSFQMLENDFLMNLFEKQAIDVKTLLKNCSFPFAAKILDSLEKNDAAMREQQQMQGIDPNAMQQAQQGANPLVQRMMNDQNSQSGDGVVR